jgi:hypothetical protein
MANDLSAPTSFRLPAELVAALRKHAEERGETISEALRRGVLMVLGKCPTCGQALQAAADGAEAPDIDEEMT